MIPSCKPLELLHRYIRTRELLLAYQSVELVEKDTGETFLDKNLINGLAGFYGLYDRA